MIKSVKSAVFEPMQQPITFIACSSDNLVRKKSLQPVDSTVVYILAEANIALAQEKKEHRGCRLY